MITGKTNIKGNLIRTILILLGIVVALLLSFTSGVLSAKNADADTHFLLKNPISQEKMDDNPPSISGSIANFLVEEVKSTLGIESIE